jgi:2-polyprenyl-3-methyl-5-hydroxy-6-metoxy-1,4-benzoquinol methylase
MTTALSDPSSTSPVLRTQVVDACPVCEIAAVDSHFDLTDLLHAIRGAFRYTRCAACKTVYQNPRIIDEDLPHCYPAAYYTHEAPPVGFAARLAPSGSASGRLRRAIRHAADGAPAGELSWALKLLGRVLAHVPALCRRARLGLPDALATSGAGGERCLEIGPGQGFTLAQLAHLGWQAEGLDIDPDAAATASRFSGCQVHVGTLTSVDIAPGSLQLIYMNHVLEHLPDIASALKRCYELLKPGGRIYLVYPNPESLGVRLDGVFSCNWDAPRHLVLPPRTAIVSLLKRLGFCRVKARTAAAKAGAYRAVARQYKEGRIGIGFDTRPRASDRLFQIAESLLVGCGASLGEEIFVTAYKN